MFTVEVPWLGHVRFVPDAETSGRHRMRIECFDVLREPRPMSSLVVTASAADKSVSQLATSKTSTNVFETTVELTPGDNVLVAIGRTEFGERMRAEMRLNIQVP